MTTPNTKDRTRAKAPSALARQLNEEFAYVLVGGRAKIARFEGGKFAGLLGLEAFKTFVANRRLPGVKVTEAGLGADWINDPGRRTYTGLTYMPGTDAPPGQLNLWRGFAAEPKEGDVQQFVTHVADVICGSDPELTRWLLAWLAHLVQRPYEKPGTAIVLIGPQGTGKSTLAEMMKRIFGDHAIVLPSADLLTRNFNSHLMECSLVAIEETPIKPREANLVKQIITADKLMCEPKGVDPFAVPNHLHLIISTNERFAVPAQHDERRYVVIHVSELRKQDTKYFAELRSWFWNGGGAGAVLHYLQNYDFTGVDLRIAPRTRALLDQKLASLPLIDRTVYDWLQSGTGTAGLPWSDPQPRSAVIDEMNDKRRSYEREVTADSVGRRLRELFPSLSGARPMAAGCRRRCWNFPPLQEARRDFERYLGQAIDWSNVDD